MTKEMISFFPLWTFHSYIATFQQHLHMIYISQLIQYSRACGSCRDFLDRGLLLTRKPLNQGSLLVKLKSSLRKLYGHHHVWTLWNICVSNDHWYVPLVNTSRSFPHSWLTTKFVTKLTRRVPPLTEHLRSPPLLSVVRVTRSLVLHVCFVDICLFFCTFSFNHCVQILITPFVGLKIKYVFPVFSDFMWKNTDLTIIHHFATMQSW